MSEGGRFVSLLLPDVIETAGRLYSGNSGEHAGAHPPRPRKPRIPGTPRLDKQETPMSTQNPTPDEVQASLTGAIAAFVDAEPNALRKAEMMIHIGQYQTELSRMAPVLQAANDNEIDGILAKWFAEGHAELKKALVNAQSGKEDFPLAKMAVSEGPDVVLAKMIDEAPAERRPALLQTIGVYRAQLHEMTGKGALMKLDPAVIDEAIDTWVDGGDGSHKALKKALADAERETRRQALEKARGSVGENELSDEKAGNAATHAASKLSGQNDKTYGARPSGEGAGARMRGSEPAPDQDDAPTPNPGSGPIDNGGKAVRPSVVISRKGTTGGLGSVRGADGGEDAGGIDAKGDHDDDDNAIDTRGKKKKPAMDKNGELAVELVKIAPQPMVAALAELSQADQVEVCQLAAQDAADLMAWSAQTGEQLAKAELDSAVADWLAMDPDTIQLKKWVAEALATAEEIPIGLAKAIMAYEARPPVRLRRPGQAA
jgi:hypothetical protein